MDDVDYDSWLAFGIEEGWCSESVCDTHDCIPYTPEEKYGWSDNSDHCVTITRLYGPVGSDD